MQDDEGVLFGGPQTRVFKIKAGAQGHRSAGMEQQKAHNHHSERKTVISLFSVPDEEHKSRPQHMACMNVFSSDFECFVCVKLYQCDGHVLLLGSMLLSVYVWYQTKITFGQVCPETKLK